MLKEAFLEAPAETAVEIPEPKKIRPAVRQAAEILEAAAEELETNGWTRGAMERDGRHCTLGAINKIKHKHGGDWRLALTELACDIRPEWAAGRHSTNPENWARQVIAGWNDRSTSKKRILRQLRTTAARLLGR